MVNRLDVLRRRYSAPISLLFVLCLVMTAHYLIPTDPDSAVMRSGSLFTLLALALYFPVRRSLDDHSLRSLVYGVVFSYVLLFCVGLGCELEFYDGLLSGIGALLRRFAAPALASPTVGTLCAFVFARTPVSTDTRRKGSFLAFFLVLLVCYGAYLLALYPGVISYDFEAEIAHFTTGEYYAAHPVFHTLFLGSLYALGEAVFGTMTAGAAVYSAVQLTLLAAMLAWSLCFISRRVPPIAVALLLAFLVLLPFHGVLAVSTLKDVLFAGLCVITCLLLYEIGEAPEVFLSSPLRILRLLFCCLLLALIRHNGVFVYLPALALLPFLCKHKRRRALMISLCALVLCLGVPRGLERALNAQKTPRSELMGIPCQQLMRTAARANDLTEEEYEEIAVWFSHAIHRYRENCADPAKGGNFDYARFTREPVDFLRLYVKHAFKHPRIYIEAFLENTIGLWYPGDTSHAHTLSGEQGEYIYLNTVYPFEADRYPIEPGSLFPAFESLLYQTMHSSKHENIPFLAQLYCPATYTFALLLITMLACYHHRRSLLAATLPIWGLTLSIFFAAGVFIRYAYPLMLTVPFLLLLVIFSPTEKVSE